MRYTIAHSITLFASLLMASCFTIALATSQGTVNDSAPTVSRYQVPTLSFTGAIGPAVSEYLVSEIQTANRLPQQQQPPLIIIVMDTPGGLVSSLRNINQAILASSIPIACLVSPSGSRAMSAGTYILYACHIAAMAPATTLGAATPVQMGMPKSPNESPDNEKEQQAGDNTSAMERKVLNDAIAYIRSLATLRGRNIEFAEDAVLNAATMTSQEALAANVIDLIAADAVQLLDRLDGFTLVIDGQNQTLALNNTTLERRQQSWRNKFIATITDPNIAYILMLIGIYGLLLEFYSPGIGIAGVSGGIALLLALYAFQLLPVNYAGLGLILLGIALIVAESMVPSFGIMGLGGVIAFALGSVFLIETELDHFSISLPLIAGVTVATTGFSFWVLSTLWKSRKRSTVSGSEAIIGAEAIVVAGFEKQGFVTLGGENWKARSESPTQTAQRVTVAGRDRLTLLVRPLDRQSDVQEPRPEENHDGSHGL